MPYPRHFRLEGLLALAALVYPLVCPVSARADSPNGPLTTVAQNNGKDRVAVMIFEVPDDLRDVILAGLRAGLKQAGVDGIEYDGVTKALAGQPELLGCLTPECLPKVAPLLQAQRFVKIHVTSIDSASFKFSMELWQAEPESARIKQIDDYCEPCTIGTLEKTLGEKVAELLAPPPKADVEITSTPPGAQLSIDGKPVGETPYAGKLAPGTYQVEAVLEGYFIGKLDIEVKEKPDTGESLQSYSLLMVEESTVPGRRSRSPLRVFKWIGVAGAAGALGTGIVWIAIDGRDIPDCNGMAEICPTVYETRNYGYALVGVGAALTGATVLMFLLDGRPSAPKPNKAALVPIVAPTRGGAVAHWQMRF